MGFLDKILGKQEDVTLSAVDVPDSAIVAVADGEIIDITTVPDPVFAQKMMGDGIAFRYDQDSVTFCAPANGELSVLFPTGHSYGITTSEGVEILIHIGINTVEAKGDGFKKLSFQQGDQVKAGDPIVIADMKKLGEKYDLSTMLVITNANGKAIKFIEPQKVVRGQSIIVND